MYYLKEFVKAILGGMCIAFGGIAYIAVDNKVIGALFFTLGLYTICTFGFNLFTGKVCYVFENKPKYIFDIVIILFGNLIGTCLIGFLTRLTRIANDKFLEKAESLCQAKLNDNLLSIFILAVFCNIFIYIAVEEFKNNPHELGKYLGLFLGVAGFILCGFEHVVANMFYFSVAGELFSLKTALYLIVMTLGNAVGAVIFPVIRKYVIK